MNIETVRAYSLHKKAVTEDMPFGEDVLAIRVMGKMFVCINLSTPDRISMKCNPDWALELRDQYNGIEGAWHFNKKYWNTVYLNRDVNEGLIKKLIDHSYEEVIKKFTKKLRTEYDTLS